MRQPKTDIPGLVLNNKGNARIVYLAAEIDSRYGVDNLPDHGRLLTNIVRWTLGDRNVLDVRGPGLLDCHLYAQHEALILHLINLSNEAAWKAPVTELIPVGPIQINVKLPQDVAGRSARSLVSSETISPVVSDGWSGFTIKAIADHEVIVIT